MSRRTKKSRQSSEKSPLQQVTQLQARSFETLATLQQPTNFSFDNVNVTQPQRSSPTTTASLLQTKLTIGQPGDRYEQEADQVAARVVQQINSPHVAQRESDSQRYSPISRSVGSSLKRKSSIPVGQASDEFENNLNSARGGGSRLEPNIRGQLESAMGADFSGVRIHTNTQADQLNRSIQARAFTTGQDVFFKQGEYNPNSRGGQELLAHELTHVVQQNGTTVSRSLSSTVQLKQNSSAQNISILGGPHVIQRDPTLLGDQQGSQQAVVSDDDSEYEDDYDTDVDQQDQQPSVGERLKGILDQIGNYYKIHLNYKKYEKALHGQAWNIVKRSWDIVNKLLGYIDKIDTSGVSAVIRKISQLFNTLFVLASEIYAFRNDSDLEEQCTPWLQQGIDFDTIKSAFTELKSVVTNLKSGVETIVGLV
ncbi:MAG: DUF4157 domain-containing protein [Cyanobacteria bacterium P01_F01_bin.13]